MDVKTKKVRDCGPKTSMTARRKQRTPYTWLHPTHSSRPGLVLVCRVGKGAHARTHTSKQTHKHTHSRKYTRKTISLPPAYVLACAYLLSKTCQPTQRCASDMASPASPATPSVSAALVCSNGEELFPEAHSRRIVTKWTGLPYGPISVR